MITQPREGDGESQLWKELVARFRLPLQAYFMRRVEDRAEAEDLTQEVFIRLMRQTERPRSDATQAYVFVTAANLLKDRARLRSTHSAKAHRSLEQMLEMAAAPSALVEDRTPYRVLVGQETLQGFVGALEDLNDRTRDIFILSRIENMQQRDIAALFGISVSAVEKHVMKALSHIAARLAQP